MILCMKKLFALLLLLSLIGCSNENIKCSSATVKDLENGKIFNVENFECLKDTCKVIFLASFFEFEVLVERSKIEILECNE